MRQHILLPLACTSILVASCSTPNSDHVHTQASDPSAVKAVLDSMNKHYDDRLRDSTAAYFASRYTKDACVLSPNLPRVCGIDAITAFYWNKGDSQTITLDIIGEEVSGTEKEVTEVGSYRVIDDEGTELDKGKFMAIYRSDEGSWKVHREIWNSDLNWAPNTENLVLE
jgi:ketosteroid isomerase-like protein